MRPTRAATGASAGVIHLAFQHDASDFAAALSADLRAIETMGKVLEGTGKPYNNWY